MPTSHYYLLYIRPTVFSPEVSLRGEVVISVRVFCQFKYPEVVHNHYKNRHFVDDHNSRRHQPISLEETWATKHWPHRVFAFLLAVTEGNMFLMNEQLNDDAETTILQFRRAFAMELIRNECLKENQMPLSATKAKRRCTRAEHEIKSLPAGMKFSGTKIVKANSMYPQKPCSYCKTRVRTYCPCSVGETVCGKCFAVHVLEKETQTNKPG